MRRALALAALALAACGKPAGPVEEIVLTRTASQPMPVKIGASAVDRFGDPTGMRAPSSDASGMADLFAYDLPTGWKSLPSTSDRLVNLLPAGDPGASCYLSFLGGTGGGLEVNVNRWRKQFGSDPLDAGQVEALPRRTMLGHDATLVEIAGVFTGMGGDEPREGYALLGLISCQTEGSLFLKFTGPAPLVAAERENFLAFSASLRVEEGAHPDLGGGGGADVHAHGEEMPEAPESAFTWTAPEGWSQLPARPFRDVSFGMAGGQGECYVSVLGGDGGGLEANFVRWCDQVGRPPLTEDEFAALERVPFLGTKVPLLQLTGDFTGMDGRTQLGHGLIGVALVRPGGSVFVKLTGPEKLVLAEREHFLAFVASIEERP